MSGIKIAVGDTLYLRLALDGQITDTAVVVKCVLRLADNSQHGSTITMTHVGEGVFKDASAVMPDTPVLTARFIVYQGDGSTLHLTQKPAMDEYIKDLATIALVAEHDATQSAMSTGFSTNQTEHDATQSALAALDDLNTGQIAGAVQDGLDAQGYSEARAVLLDFLDVAVSSRESEATAATRQTTDQAEHDATQAAIEDFATNPPNDPIFEDSEGDEGSDIFVGGEL